MAAYRRAYDSRHLQAQNRDQLRNPTFGNLAWATFFVIFYLCSNRFITGFMAAVRALVGHCCTALLNCIDAPLKLRPDDAVQICLLLLLFLRPPAQSRRQENYYYY